MHELAIAECILEVASAHARGRRVHKVCVKVGHLRQVVPSALAFSFELLAADTPLRGALLEIEDIPAKGHCRHCGGDTELDQFPFRCSLCRNSDLDLTSGEELLVDAIEVDAWPEPPSAVAERPTP